MHFFRRVCEHFVMEYFCFLIDLFCSVHAMLNLYNTHTWTKCKYPFKSANNVEPVNELVSIYFTHYHEYFRWIMALYFYCAAGGFPIEHSITQEYVNKQWKHVPGHCCCCCYSFFPAIRDCSLSDRSNLNNAIFPVFPTVHLKKDAKEMPMFYPFRNGSSFS